MTEEVERISEGIREFLQDFNDLKHTDILRALKIVAEDFEKRIGFVMIDSTTVQINSKSNPETSYIIDLNDLNAHKTDCHAFRYGKECNHMKRLKSAGVISDD